MTCTFEITPVVRVAIRGRRATRAEEKRANVGRAPLDQYPLCPIDGGLVGRFLDWAIREEIYPAVTGGTSGGGVHVAYYAAADVERIRAWLAAQPDTREIVDG